MAILQTDYAKGIRPMPIAQGAEVISVRMAFALAAVLAAADVIEFGFLPADHVPVDYIIDTDDLDSGTTVLSGCTRCGALRSNRLRSRVASATSEKLPLSR